MKFLTPFFLFAAPSFVFGKSAGCRRGRSKKECKRRRLEEATNFPTGCTYDLSAYVDTHIWLLATPTETEEKECATLVFHDEDIGYGAGKIVQELDQGEAEAMAKNSFRLGDNFDIQELLDAFNNAKSMSDKYSLITNNCATFALSMSFEQLGIEPTQALEEYVATSLLNSGVGEEIAKSKEVESLHASPKEAENPEALARLLVMSYIQDFRKAMA